MTVCTLHFETPVWLRCYYCKIRGAHSSTVLVTWVQYISKSAPVHYTGNITSQKRAGQVYNKLKSAPIYHNGSVCTFSKARRTNIPFYTTYFLKARPSWSLCISKRRACLQVWYWAILFQHCVFLKSAPDFRNSPRAEGRGRLTAVMIVRGLRYNLF